MTSRAATRGGSDLERSASESASVAGGRGTASAPRSRSFSSQSTRRGPQVSQNDAWLATSEGTGTPPARRAVSARRQGPAEAVTRPLRAEA